MPLIKFVAQPNIKRKFDSEFYYPISDGREFYRKSNRDKIGFSILASEGKVKFICDSNGREKEISDFGDLIEFFTQSKYLKHLCCFYCSPSDFESIICYLPENERMALLENQKIKTHTSYSIIYRENRFLTIKNLKTNKNYQFYNLYPLFRTDFEIALKDYLNYERIDSDDQKSEYYIEEALLVKKLAECYANSKDNFSQYTIKIINEPLTTNYTEIGTAFDYLLRFKIFAENEQAYAQPWVAYGSLKVLEGQEKETANSILKKAEKLYYSFIKKKGFTEDLIKYSLYLAKLDAVFRAKLSLKEINMDIDPEDIADLKNLIMGIPKGLFDVEKTCILNPTFGAASCLINGADADLFIDNTLIDIKTTKNPQFTRDHFNQLMGYVLLHQLGHFYLNNNLKEDATILLDLIGIDPAQTPEFDKTFLNEKIEKIGIYFSRSNYLYTLELKDIIPEGKIGEELLTWFEEECLEYLLRSIQHENFEDDD